MATLTLPTDTVLLDPDVYTFLTNLKTNVDALYGSAPVVVTDAATYSALAADSGKLHVVPDLTQTCTITLPTKAAGLIYKFWYGGAAADASDWVIDCGTSNGVFKGGVVHLDSNADAAGDEVVPVYANGSSHKALTVVKPEVGTVVTVHCDGTNWYLNGQAVSVTVPSVA